MCVFVRVCDDDDDTLGLSVCPSVFGAQWHSRRQTGSIPGCYGRCRKPARVAQSGGAVGGCAIVLLFISACVCLCVRVSVCLCRCVCVCGVAFFLFEDLLFEYVLLFEELFLLMGYLFDGDTHFRGGHAFLVIICGGHAFLALRFSCLKICCLNIFCCLKSYLR